MIPFPYQTSIMDDARELIRALNKTVQGRKPRIVLRSAAGSGKTAMSAFITKATLDKGGAVGFLCHRDYLLEQTSTTYDRLSIKHGYIAAGRELDASLDCHIGMIQSMKSRQSKIKAPSVCFVDEASHAVAKTWKEVIEAWPNTTFILLTATPSFRTDGVGLEQLADGIVHGPSEASLIQSGALSEYVWFSPSHPDLSNVRSSMGEYVMSDAEREMGKDAIVGDIVSSYRKYADGKRGVYFASSIELSKRYAEAFNRAGIAAIHIDKDSSSDERRAAAKAMARGDLKIICCMGIAAYGFDLAAAAGEPVTIEVVGLCRPTQSFPLLVQMAMRAMRAKDYPGIILDHANCFEIHNWLPDDDVDWTLSGAKRPSDIPPTYMCDGCGSILKRGEHQCVFCGTDNREVIRKIKEKTELDHINGELERIDQENRKRKEEENKEREKTARNIRINSFTKLDDFLRYAAEQKYKPVWAIKQWKLRKKGIQSRLTSKNIKDQQLRF